MTLREIAAGKVTFANIKELPDHLGEVGSESGTVSDVSTVLS
jgi:hypothetical protein